MILILILKHLQSETLLEPAWSQHWNCSLPSCYPAIQCYVCGEKNMPTQRYSSTIRDNDWHHSLTGCGQLKEGNSRAEVSTVKE